MSDVVDANGDPVSAEKAAEALNVLHGDIGQRAAELAMKVLESANPADIPFPAAVSLLKFGIELERKAKLNEKPDGPQVDPFEQLAKLASGQATTETPKEG